MTDTSPLSRLIELAEKATPGPWEVFVDGGLPLKVIAPQIRDWHGDICKVSVRPEIYADGAWDAEFIAQARNSIEALKQLLERIEAAEQVIDILNEGARHIAGLGAHEYRMKFPTLPPAPTEPGRE